MPYIRPEDRKKIDVDVSFGSPEGFTVGNLTYVFTVIANGFVKHRGKSFQSLAEVIAALEQAKDEFQRRVVHPYENRKCSENGDVYEVEDPTDQNEQCEHGKRLCGCRNPK